MPMFAFAVPLVPGRQEVWRRSVQEMLGSRRPAYEESRRRLGITGEQGWLTQLGEVAFIVTTGNIAVPQAFFTRLAASDLPFDGWLRERWRDLHGIDLAGARGSLFSEPVYGWPGAIPTPISSDEG